MPTKVEFFFDVVSSYSYLASTQLQGLVERTGAELVYRPIFLGALMQAVGNAPPATVPLKAKWLHQDLKRWAQHYGVEFNFNPSFPMNTLSAQRAITHVANTDPSSVAGFVDALFAATWVRKQDPSQQEVIEAACDLNGISAEEVRTGMTTQAIKDQLKASTDEAQARGAFGAPSFFIGERLFFGNDRLFQVEELLEDGA